MPSSETRYWNEALTASGFGVKVKLPFALMVTVPLTTLIGVVSIVIVVPASASVPPSLPAGYVIGIPACAGRPANANATGGSLTAVTLIVLVMMLLRLFDPAPSLTWKETVRVAVDGAFDVFEYITERNALW